MKSPGVFLSDSWGFSLLWRRPFKEWNWSFIFKSIPFSHVLKSIQCKSTSSLSPPLFYSPMFSADLKRFPAVNAGISAAISSLSQLKGVGFKLWHAWFIYLLLVYGFDLHVWTLLAMGFFLVCVLAYSSMITWSIHHGVWFMSFMCAYMCSIWLHCIHPCKGLFA